MPDYISEKCEQAFGHGRYVRRYRRTNEPFQNLARKARLATDELEGTNLIPASWEGTTTKMWRGKCDRLGTNEKVRPR